ncbi:Uncharacterised protein [Actinobacillus pleuropneumoniae]|nr:Uncharacterised protein [Actinobacillus pleuropneumoniae]
MGFRGGLELIPRKRRVFLGMFQHRSRFRQSFLACTSKTLLFRFDRFQSTLRILNTTTELDRELIPVPFQMEQPLQHLPAFAPLQGKEFGELSLWKHDRPGKIVHFEPDFLFDAAGDLGQLIRHHLIPFGGNANETAHRIADGKLVNPFEPALYPVSLQPGRGGQLKRKGDGQTVLRVVHDALGSVNRALHFSVHG